MKKINLLLSLLLLLAFSGNSYSQGHSNGNNTCASHVSKYKGPNNTNQLTKLLNESTNPIIQNLDAPTKASLIEFMMFVAGRPTGMSGTDANIQKLYTTNIGPVLSAIFGIEVIISTFDTKPTVTNISVADFMALYNRDPIKYAFVSTGDFCTSCLVYSDEVCCRNNGNGCFDELVLSKGTLYKVN